MERVKKTVSAILVVVLCLVGRFDIDVRTTYAETSETITVSLMKIWDDYGNINENRPESLEVTLLADNEEVTTLTISESDYGIYDSYDVCFAWHYMHDTEVPKYDESGNEIEYTWTCDEIDGYERYVEGTGNMTIITDYQTIGDIPDEEPVILKKVNEKGERLNNCLLRVADGSEEILRWISGNADSVEVAKEGVTASLNEYGDIVIYGLEDEIEYTYEELKPADGYTSSESIDFKLSLEERTYSFNWYTSIEKAAVDASNLTTENADCYRPYAEAGVFIDGDTATIILLKDTEDTQTFQLSADIILDLNENTLNMADGGSIQFNNDLDIIDGTININNSTKGINGQVSSTYFSVGSLTADNVIFNHNNETETGGTRIINTKVTEANISDCEFNLDCTAGSAIVVQNSNAVVNVKDNHFILEAKSSVASTAALYSMGKETIATNNEIDIKGNSIAAFALYIANSDFATVTNNNISVVVDGASQGCGVQAMSSNATITDNNISITCNGSSSKVAVGVRSSGGSAIISDNYIYTCSETNLAYNVWGINSCDIHISDGTFVAKSIDGEFYSINVLINDGLCEINNGDFKSLSESDEGYSYSIYNAKDGVMTISGGCFYANYHKRPSNVDGDYTGMGSGIGNAGVITIYEDTDNVVVTGGNDGIMCWPGSTTTINSGTFKSPIHGGIYAATGSTGHLEINGGTFINNRDEYTEEELNGGVSYGAGYFGSKDTTSVAWSVDIKNATFINEYGNGIVQKSYDGYIPATINLYNCYVSGKHYDLVTQNNESVDTNNAFINIYEGTILAHNTINDAYGKASGVSHIIDYREGE